MNPVAQYLERRRQLDRCARFIRDIRRYQAEVLEPRGFGGFDLRPVADKRRRVVVLGETRVWKFLRPPRRDARNTVAAAKALETAAIPGPRTEFSDFTRKTKDAYGLSCIVMNRLEGRPLGADFSSGEMRELASFLARLHSARSEAWGECHAPQRDGFFEQYFVQRARKRWKLIDEWLSETGRSRSPEALEWLARRRELLQPVDGQFCLVSGDAHTRNFIKAPTGELCLIDLDRARFLDFPADLVQLMPLETPLREAGPNASKEEMLGAIERHSGDFLRAYFSSAPAGYLEHWRQSREAYVLYQMVLKLYGVLRRRQVKFSLFKPVDPGEIETKARQHYSVIERLTAGG